MFITLNRYKSSRDGNIEPIFSTLRFLSCYKLLPFTSPFIVLISRPSKLHDTMWTNFLSALLLLQGITVQAQPPSTKTFVDEVPPKTTPLFIGIPDGFSIASFRLLGYNEDGCPTEPNLSANIQSIFVCNPITITGITKVVVVGDDKMPSTCILTLFADSLCLSTSSADIGPIFPTSRPSACIGPIRNSAGDVFEARGAILKCWIYGVSRWLVFGWSTATA